ncbi:MAG: 2-succinyl-5-enolpyruvyl-6-hydroxy-3-cyclohexene-1-carboxylic-acid synthase [Massilibacteroides sp.]|nr:2-succinyl-5-enolpyruvyl-6-hydroxy-3-cyclohexene-1-carboxylic-acid synthase [Massilibacteroides sp.]MDD3061712.1 2-succinyl-5-enolpyruvyl-6-hydroxy-3-cyclohexene-1-carboxylic-acid synthase [Massilibacteroides sp.]MDD4114325.1 2-succinyl-5-enolpyruvyl-6-hydroxy-3-cyclohexene-1-carboxylic-acid synthase [Massilibacteroides sp.]MDD4660595.1 2-succinyl-5-enolpyruvyl-6-hydroxy-3-cyclohexene-1-carboxylic-acid synthase [Massilibacteroides sp.]
MYSGKKNVLQLVSLLKVHGITHIILCPGSRNSPLIHSFVTDSDFTCYSIVDERSAGFFALGVIQAIQKPVAVCCTSGTAVLNLGPSVAEAYYQQLPLLVITADRPASWIGQMDGQTIPQTTVFSQFVRHSVQLPQIRDDEEEWYCNRLINEAILSLNNQVRGPAHINIPLSEPLFHFQVGDLPQTRTIRLASVQVYISESNEYDRRFNSYAKRMIIVGQLPPTEGLATLLQALREKQGVVVLSDQLSNIPPNETFPFDTLLYAASDNEIQELTPELVITLGGHIVSKRLKQFLRSAHIQEHWHISPAGEIVDTFQQVTDIIPCNEKTFLRYLLEKGKAKKQTFCFTWENACTRITEPETSFSDFAAVGLFMRNIPEQSTLQLANSNSLRLAQCYKLQSAIAVFCNRGTNGIDGSLSTAVGYAAASERRTFLLIGDLSFFYDMNGLWNKHIKNNLRILLNNNGGGEIFHTIPGLNRSEALEEYIAASHQTEAKAWAKQQGFRYLSARNESELQRHLPIFFRLDSKKPILFEVFTDKDINTEIIRTYYHQQKTNSHDTTRMENDKRI